MPTKERPIWQKIGELMPDPPELIIASPYEILARPEGDIDKLGFNHGGGFIPLTAEYLEKQKPQNPRERNAYPFQAPGNSYGGRPEPQPVDAGICLSTQDEGTYPVYAQKDEDGELVAVVIVFQKKAKLPRDLKKLVKEHDAENPNGWSTDTMYKD